MSDEDEVVECLLFTPGEFLNLASTLPYKIYKDSWEDNYAGPHTNIQSMNISFINEISDDYTYLKIFPNDGIYGVNEHLHQLIKNCPGIYNTAAGSRPNISN